MIFESNAAAKAFTIANKFVGNNNITQVSTRDKLNPHIVVQFAQSLDSDVRKQITRMAEPFKVRFEDNLPKGTLVNK